MSGWGCNHEVNGYCQRLKRACDPGIPGCVLYGKVIFADPDRNPPPDRRNRREKEVLPAISAEHDDAEEDASCK
ncbi:MAG: hypothetical protein IT210_09505 [Armatimonadetes bacterium]|nr:hypothetical protein [Armatimonadota bacterium]